ncbi:MAG: MATE family efflux transporter [Planctomycetota bacterium]
MQRDLSHGHVLSTVLSFGLPLALAMAAHAGFNLVDLFLVGRLGEDALAGVHVASTINFFPMILGNGISVGAVALIGQALGGGHGDRARRVANLTAVLLGITGVALGLACWLFAEPLVLALEARGGSVPIGVEYLEVVSLGTITMYGLIHLTGVLRAAGNAFWTVVLLIGTNALNIVLDVILIFGWDALGIPAYGAVGAAWATVASRALGCVVGFVVLARPSSPLRPGLALPRREDRVLHRMLGIGCFQTIQMLARAAMVLTITWIGGRIVGPSAQAALAIAVRLDTLVLFSGVGWASAATAMIAQCVVRGERQRCLELTRATAWISGALALAAGFLFFLFTEPLFRLFTPDPSPELLEVGRRYFAYLAFAYPAATASLVLAGAMNGVGRAFLPMLLDLLLLVGLLQPSLLTWVLTGAVGGLSACWLQVLTASWLLLVAYLWVLRRPMWLRGRFGTRATGPDATA